MVVAVQFNADNLLAAILRRARLLAGQGVPLGIEQLPLFDFLSHHYTLDDFEQKLLSAIDSEQGQKLLSKVTKSIYNNIQLKLSNLLEES